ncbi:hypothetical protein RCL1_005749 [Eukaryota sp. TZLM3-RCL]
MSQSSSPSPSPRGSPPKSVSRNTKVAELLKRLRNPPQFGAVLNHHDITTPQFEKIVDATPLKRGRRSSSLPSSPFAPDIPFLLYNHHQSLHLFRMSMNHSHNNQLYLVRNLNLPRDNTESLPDCRLLFQVHESIYIILVLHKIQIQESLISFKEPTG